jgi:predicted negative regulator of RcsB-dependent stress response
MDYSRPDNMTPNPAARRTRDSNIDDAFVARAIEASTWASRNRKVVITGAIILAVAAIGLLWYANYRSSLASRASTELTKVRAIVQSGNTPLAISDLEKYVDSFGGTKPASEARLMLAQQYLLAGQADKAVTTLEKLGGNEKTAEGAQASFLLAAAYEAAKDNDRAERVYLELASNAPYLFMKQEALDNAARLRLEQGNATGAVELYNRLVELTPETAPERDAYQLRLGEAQAAAGMAITPQ